MQREAVAAGLSLFEFWEMCPREYGAHIDGVQRRREYESDLALTAAWHVAAFNRKKRLPRLEKLLGRRKRGEKLPSQDELERKTSDIFGALAKAMK
ncbi:MAG: hypothetical protein KAY24_01165 [Candidatus Eisenbacteria sp.]|nr:hypothetical protein [Candidatus Eisenbacteria bacterium]